MLSDRNTAIDHIEKAQSLVSSEKYSEAVLELLTAIKLDSTIRSSYLVLYQATYYSGDKDTAIKYLNMARTVFYEDDEIVYYLGKVYQNQKSYIEAITKFNEAIRLSKKNGEDYPIVSDYYASRGICYIKQDSLQAALKDFNYSIKLNEKNGSLYVNKGIVLYKLKKYEAACTCWRDALKNGELKSMDYIEKHCKSRGL